MESLVYAVAKKLSDGEGYEVALSDLQGISPGEDQFAGSFARLAFGKTETGIARLLLGAFESHLAPTREVSTEGPERVHVEHIYPQSPEATHIWAEHDAYVNLLGNLTLLDRRLNEKIKNGRFPLKKEEAYKVSRLEVTKALLKYDDWDPMTVQERQNELCTLAQSIWPVSLL